MVGVFRGCSGTFGSYSLAGRRRWLGAGFEVDSLALFPADSFVFVALFNLSGFLVQVACGQASYHDELLDWWNHSHNGLLFYHESILVVFYHSCYQRVGYGCEEPGRDGFGRNGEDFRTLE